MQNVMLAAVDAGLGCGFAGGDAESIEAVKTYLGIPTEFTPIGVMPVGRPLPDVRSPSLKRGWVPFDEFARWEQWQVTAAGADAAPVTPAIGRATSPRGRGGRRHGSA
jgi:hypothetical protein